MIIDALVVGAVVAELRPKLLDGRIQQITQPTPESFGLEIYAHGVRHQLMLSANAQHARLHLVPTRPTRGPGPDTPLLLLLRKYVRGGRITNIECPPLERVVTFSITKFPPTRNQSDADDEDDEPLPEPFHSELVLEILGRSSNIILINDDGLVMESVRHFTRDRSERPIVPRAIYELPPRQDKRDPHNVSANGIASLAGPNLARALVSAYRGISPQTGREVAMRTLGSPDAPLSAIDDPEAVAATLRQLISGSEQRPCIARDESGMPSAVAPFWLQQYAHCEAFDSMNDALAVAYTELDQQGAHAQLREKLAGRVEEWIRRTQTKADQIRGQLERAADFEQLRWEGEMIYAYLHTLQPGQDELLLDKAIISLDPNLSGVENAQRRFRDYEKAKSAIAGLPELLENAEAQVAYGREMVDLIRLAESYDEIMALERELHEQDVLKAPKTKKKVKAPPRQGPLRVTSPDGWTIYVGRSAAQNDEVTFKLGQGDDYWLHARGRTGGHVIVRMQGAEVPPATLERAAQLAAYYSSARHDGAVEVDIARRKHVRRLKGAPPGLVLYTAERTVRVKPRSA